MIAERVMRALVFCVTSVSAGSPSQLDTTKASGTKHPSTSNGATFLMGALPSDRTQLFPSAPQSSFQATKRPIHERPEKFVSRSGVPDSLSRKAEVVT